MTGQQPESPGAAAHTATSAHSPALREYISLRESVERADDKILSTNKHELMSDADVLHVYQLKGTAAG